MDWIIYKTTNLINNKIYIGVHKQDGKKYYGSGKLIELALKKYGKDNFSCEILFDGLTREEAYEKEVTIVDQKFIDRQDTYNIRPGGRGGQGFKTLDETKNKIGRSVSKALLGKQLSIEHRKSISVTLKGRRLTVTELKSFRDKMKNREISSECRQKLSNAAINQWSNIDSRNKILESRNKTKIRLEILKYWSCL